MGISGLLPFLENASEKTHVSKFKGATAAVDAYCWLHKGAFGCAEKIAKGEDTNGYVLYCMKYIKMLQSYKIRPILVFDGQHLPAKRTTEEKRRKQRQLSKRKAAEMLRLGNSAEARKFLVQSIDVTHKMALALMKECRQNGVDCIVAPYEADAQLAYLNRSKMVDFVISEDSDLTLFGCDKIFFKMDITGNGVLVDTNKINNCMKLRSDKFSFDKFRYMCILSGCDYLESLPGVGLKKALKFISVTENPSIYNALTQLSSYLKLTNVVSDEYRDNFMIADATFQYQLVFDPRERHLRPLNTIPTNVDLKYCVNAGNMSDNQVAYQLALGNIDPFTHNIVDNWDPDVCNLPKFSIWLKNIPKGFINTCFQESTTKINTSTVIKTPNKTRVIKKEVSEVSLEVISTESEDIMDMYRKMGPVKSPERNKSNDLDVLIHGEVEKPRKYCSSAFNKEGPIVIDYRNGLCSRFFKSNKVMKNNDENDEKNCENNEKNDENIVKNDENIVKNDKNYEKNYENNVKNDGNNEKNEKSNEPMVSLLGAIDNLMKKRKCIENNVRNDEKLEGITKRRKSDVENECDVKIIEDKLDNGKPPKAFTSPIKVTSSIITKKLVKKQTSILTFFGK